MGEPIQVPGAEGRWAHVQVQQVRDAQEGTRLQGVDEVRSWAGLSMKLFCVPEY